MFQPAPWPHLDPRAGPAASEPVRRPVGVLTAASEPVQRRAEAWSVLLRRPADASPGRASRQYRAKAVHQHPLDERMLDPGPDGYPGSEP